MAFLLCAVPVCCCPAGGRGGDGAGPSDARTFECIGLCGDLLLDRSEGCGLCDQAGPVDGDQTGEHGVSDQVTTCSEEVSVNAVALAAEGDGSPESPFATVGEGLAVVCEGGTVLVAPGIYEESIVVTKPSVSLAGTGPGVVLRSPDEVSPPLVVAADEVSVSSVSLVGGEAGIVVSGSAASPVSGVVLAHILVELPPVVDAGCEGFPGDACHDRSGIRALDAVALDIRDVLLVGAVGLPAGRVSGLLLERCLNCKVSQTEVSQVSGADAYAAAGSFGIRGLDCSGLVLEQVSVHGVTGGDSAETEGGEATGIFLDGCTGCAVLEDDVAEVTSGEGYFAGTSKGLAASDCDSLVVTGSRFEGISVGGGWHDSGWSWLDGAFGIEIAGEESFVVSDCTVLHLSGGLSGPFADEMSGVGVVGIRVTGGASGSLRRNLVGDLRAGRGLDSRKGAIGIDVLADGVTSLDQTTIVGVRAGACPLGQPEDCAPALAAGFRVESLAGPAGHVQFSNGIVQECDSFCFDGTVETKESAGGVEYSMYHGCGSGVAANITVGRGVFAGKAEFVSADEGDYRLVSSSPGVDAAAPDAPCNREPSPNGCRADLGAFGNTPDAPFSPSGLDCFPSCP